MTCLGLLFVLVVLLVSMGGAAVTTTTATSSYSSSSGVRTNIRRMHRFPHPSVPHQTTTEVETARAADGSGGGPTPPRPTVANCTERYYTQKMDHFDFAPLPPGVPSTFQQRYFTCLEEGWQPGNPIFYYTGNEVDVTLFVTSTGLMWENAPEMGAMLIFAEHRYFGKSLPFPNEVMPSPDKLRWLTTDQALADYATHIHHFKLTHNSFNSSVIGFGGSYGGMLCAWLRIKYPSALDACVAGSAPIANFMDLNPPYDDAAFAAQVTYDATAYGGAQNSCAANIRQAFTDMATNMSFCEITSALQLCSKVSSITSLEEDVFSYITNAFGFMAMSSYPYPSDYLLLGGGGVLPAYPERVACKFMEQNFTSAFERVTALGNAMGVYYNATGDQMCYNVSSNANEETIITQYLWGYLSCTTMSMPFSQNGQTDMFWPTPWNATANTAACQQQYNATPQYDWVEINYGGYGVERWGSGIVFSNGALDPWMPGGILNATGNANVKTLLIPDAGHHIDLMFSNPADTTAIKEARLAEMKFVFEIIEAKRRHL